jgi:hypothetical protein
MDPGINIDSSATASRAATTDDRRCSIRSEKSGIEGKTSDLEAKRILEFTRGIWDEFTAQTGVI